MSVSTLSPWRYPGAKGKFIPILSKYLKKYLDNSNTFFDVFTGGGSVALWAAKEYPNVNIILNDKDACVSAFWKIISGNNDLYNDLINKLNCVPSVEEFYKLKESNPNNDLDRAYKAYYLNRTSFSGIIGLSNCIGGKEQNSKYTIDCRYNFKKLKEKINECRNILIGRTKVYNSDFTNLHELKDNNVAIYLDPPYIKAGKSLYPVNMEIKEHVTLSNILKERNNWILSYDDNEFIRDLYKNYKIIDLNTNYSINGKKSSWKNKNELLIMPNA